MRNRLSFGLAKASHRITKILVPGLALIPRPSYNNNVYTVELTRVLDPDLIALKLGAVLFIAHTHSVSGNVLMNIFSYRWILFQTSTISDRNWLIHHILIE